MKELMTEIVKKTLELSRAFLLMFGLVLFGCADNKAAQLLETAKFEELQNNKEHAVQLYEEIAKKYPGSEQAKIAQQKLTELKAIK